MNILLFVAVAVVGVLVGGAVIWLLWRARSSNRTRETDDFHRRMDTMTDFLRERLERLDDKFLSVTKDVSGRVERTHSDMRRSLSETARALQDVTGKLAKTEEYHRHLIEVGSHVQELGNILRAPKLRGELGETFLSELLAQMLPKEHYKLQYSFKGGETVDAAVLLSDLAVPVDAKFPLENFRKSMQAPNDEEALRHRREFLNDARKHITAIKNKYIRPDEGTSDFAFMYIPAENVFYEIMVRDEGDRALRQYALSQNVFPVSPNSFYAYLALVIKGLRALQLEEGAKEILGFVQRLRTEFKRFEDDFSILGKHLDNASKKYDDTGKRLVRLSEKVDQIEAPNEEEPPALAMSDNERREER